MGHISIDETILIPMFDLVASQGEPKWLASQLPALPRCGADLFQLRFRLSFSEVDCFHALGNGTALHSFTVFYVSQNCLYLLKISFHASWAF
jgi:hypothetical protein